MIKTNIKIGDVFGYLTVEKFVKKDKFCHKHWLCKCKCGQYIIRDEYTLLKNTNHSCGCLNKLRMKKRSSKHNLYYTKIYKIWIAMKQRCYYKKYKYYKNYGGKGIKVCDEWKNSIINFYEWALKNGYEDGLSIERVDINKDYCPENCKWIPKNQQQKNTSRTKLYKYKNEKETIYFFSKKYKIPQSSFYRKIRKGISVAEIINENSVEVL